MKLAPARQAAFAALLSISRGAWSAESLATKSAQLEPRDAALASDIVFGVLRRRGQLDAIITRFSRVPVNKLDAAVKTALEMALYQMRFLDRIPAHAAVNDSVELVRRAGKASAAALVNAVLRKASTEMVNAPESLSAPPWLLDRWIAQYGEVLANDIVRASLDTPGRYIRVGQGHPPAGAQPTKLAGCFVLPAGDPEGFRFQDIGSQSVVPLLDLRSGMTFLDVCAAPGNKSAQALESGVNAIVCELHLSRARGLKTLGAPVVVADATGPLPFTTKFDRILVDAPCSGTGTLARNPEIKWNLKPSDIANLASRQKAILRNALDRLAPGGLLVYSTCSLEREENEEVVATANANVIRVMQRLPGRDAGDGFFAAVLIQ